MRLYLDSVGCRLNQAEIADLGQRLGMAGHSLVSQPAEAEVMVLNTCTVTAKAAADSRWRVRQAHRSNPGLKVVLTGCWVTLEGEQAATLPGIWKVVPNPQKRGLVEEILGHSGGSAHAPVAGEPRSGEVRARTRAHIGIQEGCDRHCTYCATRAARGPLRSEPVQVVIDRVWRAADAGAKEVVLSGVQLGAYGRDLSGADTLASLLEEVLEHTDIPRIRLSSLEPWDVDVQLLSLWNSPRMCPHFHLPLQSGSAATLRRMARPIHPQRFSELISTVRTMFPGAAITTDLMVGFPGETEAEFEESLRFVEGSGFAGAHVFTFSPRPGTLAASMAARVPESLIKERSRQMREVVGRSSEGYARAMIGRTVRVLWESAFSCGSGRWELIGHSDTYHWVVASARDNLWNQVSEVRIESLGARGLRGIVQTQDVGPAVRFGEAGDSQDP